MKKIKTTLTSRLFFCYNEVVSKGGFFMRDIKLFVFDLDGVLTETSEQHFQAWKLLADELGIDIDLEFNETLKGVSRMDSLERILAHGQKHHIYNKEEKEELAAKKNANYQDMISKFSRKELFDGVLELLQLLKSKGIMVALGSASKNGPTLLRAMEIVEYFDYIVNPALVRGKPEPDIFLKACEALMVDPKDAVGVEDAVSGIEAIKKAGMYAIGIGNKEILKDADIIYNETKDIKLEDIQ